MNTREEHMTLKLSALPAALAALLLITMGTGPAAAQTTFTDLGGDADLRIDITDVIVEHNIQYLIIDYGYILINSELRSEGFGPGGAVIVWDETAMCMIEINDYLVTISDIDPGSNRIVDVSGGEMLSDGVIRVPLLNLGDVDDVNISIITSYSETVSGDLFFDYAPDYGDDPYFYSIHTTSSNEPPEMTYLNATPEVLWPPNNRERAIILMKEAYDPDDDVLEYFYSIVDEYGVYTCADQPLIGGIRLMASRRGWDRNGRTYTITVKVVDPDGESDSMDVTVLVPHDKGKK